MIEKELNQLKPNISRLLIRKEVVTYVTHNETELCYMHRGKYNSEAIFNLEFMVSLDHNCKFEENQKILIPATFIAKTNKNEVYVRLYEGFSIRLDEKQSKIILDNT